ncbi:hypothetical protein [Streptomyces spiramyceticus]|uniref:hypothetical protein n=1 Tax=Streptomyces spiramyceticus TaxID=299717 RepID=UPI00237B3F13|nr:hypothetical protein [Streptomyces spiramyceticus]
MRAITLASAAALGVAALSLGAPGASAADAKGTAVIGTATPSTIAAGGQVRLTVTGCNSPATVTSGVFDTTTIPVGGSATATVDWDAKRGAVYTVTYSCTKGTDTSDLTIAGGATSTPTPSATRTISATTTPVPTRPARGGTGGSVGGMDTGEIVAGAALVVAAAGGVVYVLRRRSNSRQT